MKKIALYIAFYLFFGMIMKSQYYSSDFTAKDCQGVSHNLFTELDSGKIIVLAFVMPCSDCINGALTAYSAVESYKTTHPGKFKYYLVDDFANTDCSTLSNWATTNQIFNSTNFSDANIRMTSYGSIGMPKIVVVAGNKHVVCFNKNGYADGIDIILDSILNSEYVGIEESEITSLDFSIYPNPTQSSVNIKSKKVYNTKSDFKLLDDSGKIVKIFKLNNSEMNQKLGQLIPLDGLKPGVYFLAFSTKNGIQTKKIIIQ